MHKSDKPYPGEIKVRLVEMVRGDRTPVELAERFEPTAQSIRNWMAQAERDVGRRSYGLTTGGREGLRRLRRENWVLREEREIRADATRASVPSPTAPVCPRKLGSSRRDQGLADRL